MFRAFSRASRSNAPFTKTSRLNRRRISTFASNVLMSKLNPRKYLVTVLGFTGIGFGVAFLTINERRDKRQNEFREKAESICASVDGKLEKMDLANDQFVVHITGILKADEPYPLDSDMHVSHPNALRLKRKIELYQWKEIAKTRKYHDKNGQEKTETYYEHQLEWAPCELYTPNLPSELGSNPKFPKHLRKGNDSNGVKIFEAGALRIGPEAVPQLDVELREKVKDWVPLRLSAQHARHGMRLLPCANGNELYTADHTPDRPQLGDVRVQFFYVEEGDYTIVSQWRKENPGGMMDRIRNWSWTPLQASGKGRTYDNNYVPGLLTPFYHDMQNTTLASEGEVQVAPALEKFAKYHQYDSFLIPNWIVDWAEKEVLDYAPVQVASVQKGIHDKDEAFDLIKVEDDWKTTTMRAIGAMIVMSSCAFVVQPFAVLAGTYVNAGAIGTGALISLQTINQARTQIDVEPADDEVIKSLNILAASAKDNDDAEKDSR